MRTANHQPDAWTVLCLQSMSVEQLRAELPNETGDRQRWLRDELAQRARGTGQQAQAAYEALYGGKGGAR